MKMYERFIPLPESVLQEFCKIEGCMPSEVKAKTNKSRNVKLRDMFTAFATLKGLNPNEMSEAIDWHRCNFYHAMRKETWKGNIRRYEQL